VARWRLQWPLTSKLAPTFRDETQPLGTRTESLAYENEELKYEILAHKHSTGKFESAVRIVFTILAAYATYTWASYVMHKVDDVMKLDMPGKPIITVAQEHILIALMTTTTASVLGAWAIVAKYVWHVPEEKPENKKKRNTSEAPPDSDEDDM
jgi:prophage DNA circulation protein